MDTNRAVAILIRNGEVVTPAGLRKADVMIRGEQIAAVEPGLTVPPGVEMIDARRHIILPGLIDTHTHVQSTHGDAREDFYQTSRAALAGGVTTILGVPDTSPPLIDASRLAEALALASQTALSDHGLLLGATHDNVDTAGLISEAVGLKLFMSSPDQALLVNDFATQYKHFGEYPRNRIISLHAEDDNARRHLGKSTHSTSSLSAELAMSRAIAMAADLRRPIHVTHVSTEREIELVWQAKQRGDLVTCAVTPHHLFLSSEVVQHIGEAGCIHPPLRMKEDIDALWDNVKSIDIITSDHRPRPKANGHSNGYASPIGVHGLETMLPLLLTAVHEQLISYADLVRLTSAGPAKLFGLKNKGRIEEGAHADLVIVNPATQWRISCAEMRTPCDWTPFEGWRVRGRVEQVFLRGQLVFDDGQFLVEPGYGRRVEHGT